MNPNREFVPLSTAATVSNAGVSASVTVLPQAANAQPFRPLGQSAPAVAATHGAACEPRVTLLREGDRVTTIQVNCGCGQLIELACVYGS
ncbi:MAG TPA: hypothetical protein VEH04_00295 [Verrucomicrobiae bacterium]|nr:hypothetical protein [Verrucomicrobiae bacterium]